MSMFDPEKQIMRRDAFQIPENLSPVGTRCIQVDIPDDDEWEAQLFAVLTLLTKWNSFVKDTARNATNIATIWRAAIWGSYRHCDGSIPTVIQESEYEMSLCEQLRFSNGKLQAYCCGEWVTITGQPSQGIGGSGQPGAGTGVPSAGQCQSYHATMNASDQWLCPAVVNAGDTVIVSNMTGAWGDGSALWFCPDGKEFFAGFCTVTTVLDALDPIPTQPHMALLTKIAGAYHNISDGLSFTVPGGVSNALLIFQPNDHSLSDNSGEITFDVQVCNNQTVTFTHTFNFALTDGGFVDVVFPAGFVPTTYRVWSSGSGWTPTDGTHSGPVLRAVSIHKTFPHITLTGATLQFNLTKGTIDVGVATDGLYFVRSG
jgi:hypothetical protein